MGLLKDKVAVITGAASGMGLGTAEAFIAEGAQVVIADIQDERGEAAARALGDSATYVHTDVTDEEQIARAVATAVEVYGRLDVMFNNAGHVGDTSSLLDVTMDGFLSTVRLLAGAAVAGHKYAARQFRDQGGGGSIITTSSVAGLQAGYSPVGYAASKAAVLAIVRQGAFELSADNIRSNAIIPGTIATPIMAGTFGVPAERADAFTDFVSERLATEQPIGRVGQPADIAGAAIYLASDLSAFVTGTSILVDGGISNVYMGRTGQVVLQAAQDFLS